MNIHPRRVFVERGSYQRPSVCVALTGNPIIETAWALNMLAVRAPLNCRWRVVVADNEATAAAEWQADTDAESHLLIWPVGQYLGWNAITEGLAAGVARVQIGSATLIARDGIGMIDRRDLASDGTSAGHPIVSDQPAQNVNPALSVVLGIPSLGRARIEWARALAELAAPIGCVVSLVYVEGFEVGEARSKIVDRVLSMRPRPAFLFFLGDDNLPPSGLLRCLYDDLQAYPDIACVGGLYHTKTDPPQVCAWNETRTLRAGVDYRPGEMIEVRSMGLDACLMRTGWIAKVPPPQFATVQRVDSQATEDSYFFVRARESTGRSPWIDTKAEVGHIALDTGRVY